MSEFNEVLDLCLVKSQGHASQNLSNGIDANCDVLILAVLSDVVVDYLLCQRFYFFWRYEFVTSFDNHGENLADFVLLVGVEVSKDERVELDYDKVVASNESRDKPEHEQLDLILVI